VVDSANALTWHMDGVAVPVEPPSWDIGTSNALLSAHTTCAPAAKRRRGINPSAHASGADTPGSGVGEKPLVTVIPSSSNKVSGRARPPAKSTAGGPASGGKLSVRKPRIQALRSCLIKRMHDGILEPSANDDVYHSRENLGPFMAAVVMEVAKVEKEGAESLLLTNFSVPAASNSKLSSSKMLKPWLCKTRNNELLAPQFCPGGQGLGLTAFSQRRRKLLNIQVFHIGCKQVGNEYNRRHASTSISLVSLMCPVITGYVPSLRAEWASPDTLCPT